MQPTSTQSCDPSLRNISKELILSNVEAGFLVKERQYVASEDVGSYVNWSEAFHVNVKWKDSPGQKPFICIVIENVFQNVGD